jgi:hypothetical protein
MLDERIPATTLKKGRSTLQHWTMCRQLDIYEGLGFEQKNQSTRLTYPPQIKCGLYSHIFHGQGVPSHLLYLVCRLRKRQMCKLLWTNLAPMLTARTDLYCFLGSKVKPSRQKMKDVICNSTAQLLQCQAGATSSDIFQQGRLGEAVDPGHDNTGYRLAYRGAISRGWYSALFALPQIVLKHSWA